VWRRTAGWTSMPHLIDQVLDGVTVTRCGNEVGLGYGVVGITQTQIPTDLFIAVGCGMCRMCMGRDLKAEILEKMPDAKAQLKKLLGTLEWSIDAH
jgi:hypothetical protein